MKMRNKIIAASAGVAILAGSMVLAAGQPSPEVAAAINARRSHMALNAFNITVLGRMAQGDLAYDAAAAQGAADNLAALALMNEMSYWPMGSSSDDVEGTRALPAIWASGSDIGKKVEALVAATAAMKAAAGSLDGVRANMRALGGACGACHKAFRQPKN